MLASGFMVFGCYDQVFNPFGVNVCAWCKTEVQLHLSQVAIQFSVCRRDRPFPIVYSWLLCHELIHHICVGLFISVKNTIGILMGIALNLYIALRSVDVLTIFFQPMNMEYFFIYLCIFQFFNCLVVFNIRVFHALG